MMAVNLPLLLLLPVILAESIIDHIRMRGDLSQVSIFDTTRNWRLSETNNLTTRVFFQGISWYLRM